MLVLSRRIGESLVIGDGVLLGDAIRIKVVGVQGRSVRLGIIAPDSVRVDRAEIHERRRQAFVTLGMEEPCKSFN